jgi:hypothetical protein
METIAFSLAPDHTTHPRLWRMARILAVITIAYNTLEGIVSVWFGIHDETLALFGFGVDSFVEVISGIGILHLVRRMNTHHTTTQRDAFERTALRTTGGAFYLLTAGLVVSAIISLVQAHKPETTLWGMVISLVSIGTMALLIRAKLNVGRSLNSDAIIADANCTKACLYLSLVLLVASVGYELTGWGGIDALGTLGIAWFAFKEGKESFDKAQGKQCCNDCSH